jgi:hypothetical protein
MQNKNKKNKMCVIFFVLIGEINVFISLNIYILKDILMLREMSLWITKKYIKRNGFDHVIRARFRLRFGYFVRTGLSHFVRTGLGYFMKTGFYHLTRAGIGYFMRG